MQLASLNCPTTAGGCGSDDRWRVTLDRSAEQVILVCTGCGHRLTVPLSIQRLHTANIDTLDETGQSVET